MTEADKLALAVAWVKDKWASSSAGPDEPPMTVFERVDELKYEDPETLWDVIRLALDASQDETEVIEVLAAGPLEDLLVHHGAEFIERVEQEARRNPRFAHLLGGVWQSSMADDLWRPVQVVWNRRGWDGIPP